MDDPLPTSSPESSGVDVSALEGLSERLDREEHRLHSLLVARGGALVFEEYFSGYAASNPHDLRSATKSITSLLVGIAIDRGVLSGVETGMMQHLGPVYPHVSDKGDIQLQHLLTMSSGLDCDDGNRSTRGQEDRMYRSADWVDYFLTLERTSAPGDTTRYCTGGVVALGEVVAQSAGMGLDVFAEEALFGPLGIRNYRWASFNDGHGVDAGGHLLMTPRAMAKIGMLVLQGGDWDGHSLVSASWITESTRPRTSIGGIPYGYLWWSSPLLYGTKSVDVLWASGNGGQTIFIVPEYELVCVFTAGYFNSEEAQSVFEIFRNVVMPSVVELQALLPRR
jgi:CubicO group peptidase (beta-lactamase class C family)